eukprot:TRINITY_DN4840_c0_g1_i1.p1 TRINITY_DN4840_c0_g1~~TRINITY_DN4840_c0_g1_i1.p1  ORF type:complete len:309 (+),score=56.39 TRINITY_DN4840_c0_g1_i1:96-1022(+)
MALPPQVLSSIRRCAEAISQSEAILITAGAGIGVDSGLPDFRGNEGFWKAYPPYAKLGLSFAELANPQWFFQDPTLAWGFYGHRLRLYRKTVPHSGFSILNKIVNSSELKGNYFVFTTNVDGQFQKAGFADDRIVERHGSIHHLQCTLPCTNTIFPVDEDDSKLPMVDSETFRASKETFPKCIKCSQLARPNILMFGDGEFIGDRSNDQMERFQNWMKTQKGRRLTIIEIGAGTAVPTARIMSESAAADDPKHRLLIRVNVRESQLETPHSWYTAYRNDFQGVSLSMGGAAAMEAIWKEMNEPTQQSS